MITLFGLLVWMILLFFILLVIKNFFKEHRERFCVICVTVSLTWVVLLVLFWLKLFEDKIIIALLMGQSILGVYYILEGQVKEELKIFRLPFLLTLIIIGYLLLTIANELMKVII